MDMEEVTMEEDMEEVMQEDMEATMEEDVEEVTQEDMEEDMEEVTLRILPLQILALWILAPQPPPLPILALQLPLQILAL
jgi:hypothetical protein